MLESVRKSPPSFFEEVGGRTAGRYGLRRSVADAGKTVGGSGDGGIDGIIKEDKLGLDVVYVQEFAGSLE